MKITCECLIDSTTGLPLVLDFPNHTKEDLIEIRTKAWESGQRFRLGLLSMTTEDKGRSTHDALASFAQCLAARIITDGRM